MNSIQPRGLYYHGIYVPSQQHYSRPVNGTLYLWDDLIGVVTRRDVHGQMFVFIQHGKLDSNYRFRSVVDLQAVDMIKV